MAGSELEELIADLEQQQRRLQFSRFTNDDAWELGSLLVSLGRTRGLVLTVDIRRHGHQLFHAALPGTTADNDSWVERKVRVVNRFGDSSFLVGRRLALTGKTLDVGSGIDPILYAAHGGSFPIIIRDVGVVGTVTVSGLPQAQDHALVVEAIETFLSGTS
ncbi:MAG: heme-degrading domain-containing protein [Nakamurella sp.]